MLDTKTGDTRCETACLLHALNKRTFKRSISDILFPVAVHLQRTGRNGEDAACLIEVGIGEALYVVAELTLEGAETNHVIAS